VLKTTARPHDIADATSPLEILAIAAMIGSLACLLYIAIHIGVTKIYQTMKKIITNGDDKDPGDEPRIGRTKETKNSLAEERKRVENISKGVQLDSSSDDFDEVLRKRSDAMGHSRLKAKRWIREQKKKGQANYNEEQKEAKKREQSTQKAAPMIEQTENVKQTVNELEGKVAECCRKAEEALGKAPSWAYGTMEVSYLYNIPAYISASSH